MSDPKSPVHVVAELKRQKEAARLQYEATLKRLHQAEETETRANVQLQATQRLVNAFDQKKALDESKQQHAEVRQSRRRAELQVREQGCAVERARRTQAKEQRDALDEQRAQMVEQERQRRAEMLKAAYEAREDTKQRHAEMAAARKAEHHVVKHGACEALAQQIKSMQQDRQRELAHTLKEFNARAELEQEWRHVVKRERAKELAPRPPIVEASKRAMVAQLTAQQIEAERKEKEALRREMQRLAEVEQAAVQRMREAEEKVLTLNATLLRYTAKKKPRPQPQASAG